MIDPFTRKRPAAQEVEVDPPKESENELESVEGSENANPKIEEASGPPPAYRDYADFCLKMQPLIDQYCSSFVQRIDRLDSAPLISIILPVFNAEPKWLREAIESVKSQIYPNW